jgi:hypothetical protein
MISRVAAVALVAAIGAVGAPRAAEAAPIVTGVWYQFSFTEVGVDARGCSPADPAGLPCTPSAGTPTSFAPEPAWTFDIGPGGGELVVTDAFLYGDSFAVFNFGVLLGSTPLVAQDGGCGSDPVVCAADPLASTGIFALAPGLYSLTIQPTAVVSAGAAYFTVTQQVPEPGLLALTMLGAGAILARRRGRTF